MLAQFGKVRIGLYQLIGQIPRMRSGEPNPVESFYLVDPAEELRKMDLFL